ncbi:Uncharacterised protein [uncultured Eubacterium sp.]|nr:Uncharacterised protein [uncultured Eubacterium sp.]
MITVEPEDSQKFYEFIKARKCALECTILRGLTQ